MKVLAVTILLSFHLTGYAQESPADASAKKIAQDYMKSQGGMLNGSLLEKVQFNNPKFEAFVDKIKQQEDNVQGGPFGGLSGGTVGGMAGGLPNGAGVNSKDELSYCHKDFGSDTITCPDGVYKKTSSINETDRNVQKDPLLVPKNNIKSGSQANQQ